MRTQHFFAIILILFTFQEREKGSPKALGKERVDESQAERKAGEKDERTRAKQSRKQEKKTSGRGLSRAEYRGKRQADED